MRKVSPGLYYKLGIYLALISTNCIILAVPLVNAGEKYTFIQSLAFGLGSGLGFALALIIMQASVRSLNWQMCRRVQRIADGIRDHRLMPWHLQDFPD